MPTLGAPELLIVLAIVVVLFGASRIPEIMGGMGKGIREFRRATRDEDEAVGGARKIDEPKKVDPAAQDVV
jgi:sec-independent protein translocase protein TatA